MLLIINSTLMNEVAHQGVAHLTGLDLSVSMVGFIGVREYKSLLPCYISFAKDNPRNSVENNKIGS